MEMLFKIKWPHSWFLNASHEQKYNFYKNKFGPYKILIQNYVTKLKVIFLDIILLRRKFD